MINHHEWKIHKILKEEKDRERLHRCLFLYGRGNGKSSLMLEEFENIITTTYKQSPARLCNADIELIRKAVVDYDMYNYLMSPYKDWVDKCIYDLTKDYYQKRRDEWKPIVRIDTTAVDHHDYLNWFLRYKYINPYLTTIFKIDESNLD